MRLALLGDPVAHSRSPAIHTAALAEMGMNGHYVALRVDTAGFGVALDDLRAGRLDGANVTMPHKALAAVGADDIDHLVEATGAANTLRASSSSPGRIEATNTDVPGLQWAAAARGIPFDAPVLILGGGGAAAAAEVAFVGRDLRRSTRSGTGEVPWGTGMSGAVVVNATPLGMHGEALPAGLLLDAAGLIDMAYGAECTPAIAEASALGVPRADGIDVLVAQAAASFAWWTGAIAPVEAMETAARRV